MTTPIYVISAADDSGHRDLQRVAYPTLDAAKAAVILAYETMRDEAARKTLEMGYAPGGDLWDFDWFALTGNVEDIDYRNVKPDLQIEWWEIRKLTLAEG